MTTRTVVLELGCRVGLIGNRRWLGGNAPENHSSGLLDGFQTLAQKIGVSMPELDVIGRCGSGLKPDCLADHEGHSLGFGLADLLGGQCATVASVQHLVGDLVRERGKLLGRLHPGKQSDLAAIRETLRGSNSLGETKLDALRFYELEKAFAV